MTDAPAVVCPRCGEKNRVYGDPASPFLQAQNFCEQCGAPLTEQEKVLQERDRSAVIDAVTTKIAEQVIERGAIDLGIDPKVARALVIQWVKRQP